MLLGRKAWERVQLQPSRIHFFFLGGECMKQNGPRQHNVVEVVVQKARKKKKTHSRFACLFCALGHHCFHSDIFIAIYI